MTWIGGSGREHGGGGGAVATDRLVVARWSRYGQIRLYVSTPDGAEVGWVDLGSGQRSLQLPELAGAFDAAIADAEPDLSQPLVADALTPPAPDAYVPRRAPLLHGTGTYLPRRAFAQAAPGAKPAGVDGKETVRARLDQLRRDGWFVLDAVPVGSRGTYIDHVLIGPGGVFTLNTKAHPKADIWIGRTTVLVDGQSQPYLRNSRFEADRACQLLSTAVGWRVEVTPALVFLTDTFLPQVTMKDKPDGVVILDRLEVPKYFRKRPAQLNADQVQSLFDHARRSSTWA